MTPKAYLGWRTLPAVLTEEMEELKEEEGVLFETYKTSVLSHAAANTFRPYSAYFDVDLPHIPWWKVSGLFCVETAEALVFRPRDVPSAYLSIQSIPPHHSFAPGMWPPLICTSCHMLFLKSGSTSAEMEIWAPTSRSCRS